MDENSLATEISSAATLTVDKPRNKGGRPRGSKTKKPPELPADASVREVIYAAFRELGGLKALVKWGKEHPEKFYRLFTQCGPRFTPSPHKGRPSLKAESLSDVVIESFSDQVE